MEQQEEKLPHEVSWKAGKRTSILPVGQDGCRVVITEYFTKTDGKMVPVGMTLKTEGPVAR